MKRVICFARVSTLQQSLDAQVDAVRKQIFGDGYSEEQIIYIQGKESAIKLDEEQRQTLNEMKLLVSDYPDIEAIYFFAVDRLARRMSIVLNVVEWGLDNGINLVFLNPHRMSTIKTNEKGEKVEDELTKLLLAMLSYGAEMEMKIKKARFATAKAAMKAQGKMPQGKPIKGYYLDACRNILVNEEEAELVRGLFNDYLYGEYSLVTLHQKYAKKGLFKPCTNRSTIKVRIHNMLNNTAYSGNPTPSKWCKKKGKDEVVLYPPIVSKELQEAIALKLRSRKSEKKIITKYIHLAKGLLRCKICNHLMSPQIGVCNYACMETGEHNVSVNLNVADSVIWYNAAEWYKYYMKLDFENTKKEYSKKVIEAEQSVKYLDSLINKELENQDKAFKKYYQGKVREEVYDAIIEESERIVSKLNNELAQQKLSLTEFKRLIDNVDKTRILQPSELFSLNDGDKVDIIKKVVNAMYVERLGKFKYKFTLIPTDMLKPFILDTEYYIYYASPNANKLEVYYLMDNEWQSKNVTDIIIKRHQRKKYGKH